MIFEKYMSNVSIRHKYYVYTLPNLLIKLDVLSNLAEAKKCAASYQFVAAISLTM